MKTPDPKAATYIRPTDKHDQGATIGTLVREPGQWARSGDAREFGPHPWLASLGVSPFNSFCTRKNFEMVVRVTRGNELEFWSGSSRNQH